MLTPLPRYGPSEAQPSGRGAGGDDQGVARVVADRAARRDRRWDRRWSRPGTAGATGRPRRRSPTGRSAPNRCACLRIRSIRSGPMIPSGKPGKLSTAVVRSTGPPAPFPRRPGARGWPARRKARRSSPADPEPMMITAACGSDIVPSRAADPSADAGLSGDSASTASEHDPERRPRSRSACSRPSPAGRPASCIIRTESSGNRPRRIDPACERRHGSTPSGRRSRSCRAGEPAKPAEFRPSRRLARDVT